MTERRGALRRLLRIKPAAFGLAVIGLTGWPWLIAVVVARLADIFKVLPGVGMAERLPGSLGITMDDVVAGLYGLAAGWIAHGIIGL